MLWEYVWSAFVHLLNMIVIGGLAWHAFRQSERIKELTDKLDQAELHIGYLESECNHQSDLAWNRLSDAEKDAAIRMG